MINIWSDQSFYINNKVKIEFSNFDKVHIKNLDIDGKKDSDMYIKFNNINKVILENLTITNCKNNSFLDLIFHRVDKVYIKNLHCDNVGNKPLSTSNSNIIIEDSFINGSKFICSVSRPTYLDNCDLTIRYSRFKGCSKIHQSSNVNMNIENSPKVILNKI